MNWLDRAIAFFAPGWGESRALARLKARHFEAASVGRRTSGWQRKITDANAAAAGPALSLLRAQARDLVRNNPWARRGLQRITSSVVGWGIRPKASGLNAAQVMKLWKSWAETTECDAAGRNTFYGLQKQVMRTVVESGEVLIRRRTRLPADGLSIPMQLQVLEPDFIDTSRDGIPGLTGGPIIQGIEYDLIGRRVAYWLFDRHPGSLRITTPVSKRVPADGILHVYNQERPGQVRGYSWFAPVDVRLHDFDEFEGATLMKQKIAACMAAFVTDTDGQGTALGEAGTDSASSQPTDTFEPGMILNLPPGKTVTIANPPTASDYESFAANELRGIAAGLGVTYEDLTGDYSKVNYSSARMARLAFNADVEDWRCNMLIPQFCAPVWEWMLETVKLLPGYEATEIAPATWTPPPAPMLDPDKEGAANTKMIRAGQKTHDEMVREQGYDPDDYWTEYAEGLKRLDKLGIVLDSDPRKTTIGGQAQVAPSSSIAPTSQPAASPAVAEQMPADATDAPADA